MTRCGDLPDTRTREVIAERRGEAFGVCAAWIERAVARGDICAMVPTDVAATYVDLQFGNAMSLIKRNEAEEMVEAVMQLAFSVFR